MPRHFDPDRVAALIELLAPARLTRVADIGANPIHTPDYDPLRRMGGCEVWGFEPQPDAFAALQANPQQGETHLPYAIGAGGPARLHVCASGGFTSLLEPDRQTLDHLGRWHKAMEVVEVIEVETHRLDDLDDLPPPDLLKIDIQGGELDVFRNARAKLSGTMAVITEVGFVPLYRDQPLFHAQAAELSDQGFDLARFLSLKSKTLGSAGMKALDWRRHQTQLIDGDALFIRRLYAPDSIVDEALKHLAILSDSVFESFDLTLKCLDLLAGRGHLNKAATDAYIARLPFPKPAPDR